MHTGFEAACVDNSLSSLNMIFPSREHSCSIHDQSVSGIDLCDPVERHRLWIPVVIANSLNRFFNLFLSFLICTDVEISLAKN
jgi:hypothetical protein